MADKLILITGVNSGLGQALAREALAQGWRVAGTVRSEEARRAFEAEAPNRAFGRILELTETARIAELVNEIENNIGPIDVLVNNAGYAVEGPLEECPLDDYRRQFEVNVFAPIAMIQAVLPGMRRRRAGRILNMSSVAGFIALPGLSPYAGSKFAMEGISAALSKELRPLGIFVTAIAPGSFRTDWGGRSMEREPRRIADYDATFEPQRAARRKRSGQQQGDPAKAAKAILKIAEAEDAPVHLPLGKDCVDRINEQIEALRTEMEIWRELSLSTNFD